MLFIKDKYYVHFNLLSEILMATSFLLSQTKHIAAACFSLHQVCKYISFYYSCCSYMRPSTPPPLPGMNYVCHTCVHKNIEYMVCTNLHPTHWKVIVVMALQAKLKTTCVFVQVMLTMTTTISCDKILMQSCTGT